MASALMPLADPKQQPESFFEGYRLLGVDGTQWSVSNTPALVSALPKAASRRLRAAFAKLRLVSVVELGTHAPVAALAAPLSDPEQVLAQQLWAKIPEHSLVIGDRLFGTPRTLWQALRSGRNAISPCWCGFETTSRVRYSSASVTAARWYRSRSGRTVGSATSCRIDDLRGDPETASGLAAERHALADVGLSAFLVLVILDFVDHSRLALVPCHSHRLARPREIVSEGRTQSTRLTGCMSNQPPSATERRWLTPVIVPRVIS